MIDSNTSEDKRMREAADWVMRLHNPNLSYAMWQRWRRWMATPENKAAFDQASALSRYLRAVASEAERLPAMSPSLPGSDEGRATGGQPQRWRRRWVASIAACVLSLLVGVIVIFTSKQQSLIETSAGQWGKRMLEDGSVVFVAPKTKIKVAFTARARSVTLSSGEAVFDVAKDSSKPFVVHTALISVRAIGTQFGVTGLSDQVTVTVQEGKVAVSGVPSAGRGHSVELVAGMQATFSAHGEATRLRQVDAFRKLQWTTGWCTFDGESLREAVEELNRRNAVQLSIESQAFGEVRLGYNRFKCDDPMAFARGLQASGIGVFDPKTLTLRTP